jgi:hypothetical protein
MGWAPKEASVENDRVLPDVDFKSRRGPPTDGLNCGKINPSFSKGSSPARPNGMAGVVAGEENTEAFQKPMPSGNRASGSEPKLRVKREESIVRLKVIEERSIRVCGGVKFLNKNGVTLKRAVTLMGGQEKGVLVRKNADCVTKGDLAVVPKDLLVRKNQLPKPHERMEACEEQSTEEEVIMRRM